MHLSRLYTKAKLDLLFAILAVLVFFCLWVISAPFNQVALDLLVGVLSAIGMFYLLVRLPEYERRKRIKRHLNISYQSFKYSVIQIFLGSIQGSYDSESVDRLMDQRAFRDFFKEPYGSGQNKWDGVANKMSDFMLRQLVLETEVLFNEFQHALGVIDIRDPEVYSFMKRLSVTLYRAKNWSADYDGTKEVLSFFWSVFTGWSVSGYTEREYIPDMISEL